MLVSKQTLYLHAKLLQSFWTEKDHFLAVKHVINQKHRQAAVRVSLLLLHPTSQCHTYGLRFITEQVYWFEPTHDGHTWKSRRMMSATPGWRTLTATTRRTPSMVITALCTYKEQTESKCKPEVNAICMLDQSTACATKLLNFVSLDIDMGHNFWVVRWLPEQCCMNRHLSIN